MGRKSAENQRWREIGQDRETEMDRGTGRDDTQRGTEREGEQQRRQRDQDVRLEGPR